MYLSIVNFATTMLLLITGQLVYYLSVCKLGNDPCTVVSECWKMYCVHFGNDNT